MSLDTPTGEEAVPKSYIRKILLAIINNPEGDADEKIRACEALAKLEAYVGPGSQGSHRQDMKKAVQIVQTSKYTMERPKVPIGLARRKVGDPPVEGA